MSNILPEEKQVAVLTALTEGCSIRSTERMMGVSQPTILSLLVRVGEGCARLMDKRMRGLHCDRLELDEQWSFIAKKQRHVTEEDDPSVVGDVWLFVAIDADTKLVPCYRVGKRDAENTNAFVADLTSRIQPGRVQISTDGLSTYVEAVELALGARADFGQIIKSFESEAIGPGRYSPPKVTAAEKFVIQGSPDVEKISTSYVERLNLTTRMQMRRYARLTNAFSKKPRNHRAAIGLHFAAYNFTRTHMTTRITAMGAGVTNRVWSMTDLLDAAIHGVCP